MNPTTGSDPTRGRWWRVVAAVPVQLALGAVLAWSVFNAPPPFTVIAVVALVALVLPLVTKTPSAAPAETART